MSFRCRVGVMCRVSLSAALPSDCYKEKKFNTARIEMVFIMGLKVGISECVVDLAILYLVRVIYSVLELLTRASVLFWFDLAKVLVLFVFNIHYTVSLPIFVFLNIKCVV